MKKRAGLLLIFLILAAAALAREEAKSGSSAADNNLPSQAKISKPGLYAGYSKPVYDSWIRTSRYISVRDGTRLAVDIIFPALASNPASETLPLLWTFNRYHRAALLPGGKVMTVLDQMPWLQLVLKHGYIFASVDVRGSGASFGASIGAFNPQEARDAYDVTEWFAAQPWCTGKIGMYGISYLGITQYLAASQSPPHLIAVMPDMAMFDLYSFVYPGGVFQDDFLAGWSRLTRMLDTAVPPPPVDDDPQGVLLARARAEHNANRYPDESQVPFRDGLDPVTGKAIFNDWSPSSYLKDLRDNGSRTAVYVIGGWFDMWPRDSLVWFANLPGPKKVLITPWSHSHDSRGGWKDALRRLTGTEAPFDYGAEILRWYDYWLKGIDNGVMDEPPVATYTMGAPKDQAWRTAPRWPLPEEKHLKYYFHGGPTGSVKSANDGLLAAAAPPSTAVGGAGPGARDEYTVDYSTSTGKTTRWTNGRGGDFNYPDMRANDAKALTYTSEPLKARLEVTGHPVVHIWISSTADDADVFAYLEEVDEKGYSQYLTEGVLRASHRKLDSPPFEYFGLPYHRGFKEDIAPLAPGEPVELVFDLHPTSNVFDRGHRIRVALTCSDQTSFLTPDLAPPPRITVYRGGARTSYIQLPVIPVKGNSAKLVLVAGILIVAGLVLSIVLRLIAFNIKIKRKAGRKA
ncbi:MAG: CocE/NonD family hydrolase [Candidatus Aminicenantes bacterium]|nr:CocE/NonD family hydrolase [Candidatus Aminicenantes bacterium]